MTTMIVDELARIPMSPFLTATLTRAAEYAASQSHREVSLEHLLLALAEDPEASVVLKSSNVDVERLMTDVSAYLGRIDDRIEAGGTPAKTISGDLRRILEAAAAAAQQGRRKEINGAIVLAAIVGDGKSPAAHMLRSQGLTFEEAIRALQRAVSQPAKPSGPPPRATTADDILASARERVLNRTAPPEVGLDTTAAGEPARSRPSPPGAELALPAEQLPASGASAQAPPQRPQTEVLELDEALKSVRQDVARRGGAAAPSVEPQWQPSVQRPEARPQQPMPDVASRPIAAPAPAAPPGRVEAPGTWAPQGAPGPAPTPPAMAPPRPMRAPPPLPPNPGPPPAPFDAMQRNRRAESGQPVAAPQTQRPVPGAGSGAPPAPGALPPWLADADPSQGRAQFDEALARLEARRPPPVQGAPSMARPPGQPAAGAAVSATTLAGQLVENIPRRMRVAVPSIVEVRIARDNVKSLAEGLQGGGGAYVHKVTVTKAMSVRLRAPDGGFYIESASPETQWIDNVLGLMSGDYASWRWTVTPKSRGKRRLQLVISARTVGSDGVAAETALPDQVVEIRVSTNYGHAAVRWVGWAAAAVAGGLFARFGEGAFETLKVFVSTFTRT